MSVAESAADAERALLGAMMLSPAAVWEAQATIRPSDFHDPRHETIASAIGALTEAGIAVDTMSVADRLIATGEVQRVPLDYVLSLTSQVPTVTNAGYYADIVKRHAGLRLAARAATVLGQGVAEGRDVVGLIDEAKSLLDGVLDERAPLLTVGDLLPELTDALDRPPVYHPTQWPALNGYINGLMPGCVYVIAARPGSGKTIMGMQAALDLAQHGSVVYFSLEMPRQQLMRRIVAQEADVSLRSLTRHTLSAGEWERIAAARATIASRPVYIDDRSGPSMTQMEAFARQAGRKAPLAGIVVDYLGLIPNRDSRKPKWEHIGDLTRAFKILSKELGVPVLLLVQLNRESEKDKRLPHLADLRDSGAIEQDADVVLMLQRQKDSNGEPSDVLDVVVAKNRHGQMGRVELLWEGEYARLSPLRQQWATPTVDFAARAAGES